MPGCRRVERYCRRWVLPEEAVDDSKQGKPCWRRGTTTRRQMSVDVVET